MPLYILFFYNDRNIKMVRNYIALRVKRKTETKHETNGPICWSWDIFLSGKFLLLTYTKSGLQPLLFQSSTLKTLPKQHPSACEVEYSFQARQTDKDWLPGTSTDLRNKLHVLWPQMQEYFSNPYSPGQILFRIQHLMGIPFLHYEFMYKN